MGNGFSRQDVLFPILGSACFAPSHHAPIQTHLALGDDMASTHHPLIILGSGPAGLTAAIYASRAGRVPLVIAGNAPGGQLTTTTEVENWPADADGVMGPELMERFERHASRFGARIVQDHIQKADLASADGAPISLDGSDESYTCDALIIATGAKPKLLGIQGEQSLWGRGASSCATCDGFFHRGREVAVAGGGNTAVEEALYLSKIASKVHLIHRRSSFRAEQILVERLMQQVAQGKVALHLDSRANSLLGDRDLEGARIEGPSGAYDLALSGFFVAIGHAPNTELFTRQLDMDEAGYILTRPELRHGGATSTSQRGVFACGDVQDPTYRQAITSAASGCQAALDADSHLGSMGL
jgi:thioredoxin reductase (NADPH)